MLGAGVALAKGFRWLAEGQARHPVEAEGSAELTGRWDLPLGAADGHLWAGWSSSSALVLVMEAADFRQVDNLAQARRLGGSAALGTGGSLTSERR